MWMGFERPVVNFWTLVRGVVGVGTIFHKSFGANGPIEAKHQVLMSIAQMHDDKFVLHSVLENQSWTPFVVTDFINAGVVLQGVKQSRAIVGFDDTGKSRVRPTPRMLVIKDLLYGVV